MMHKIKNVKKNFGEPVGDIFVKSSKLKPIKFSSHEFSSTLDEMPILFILASQIRGVSTFSNIKTLRGKESDRIENIENGLKKIGIKTISTKNSLKISGNPNISSKAMFLLARRIPPEKLNFGYILCFKLM